MLTLFPLALLQILLRRWILALTLYKNYYENINVI